MQIRVKNVLGVEAAEFAASRISLIGGHNAAGKSSLLEAIACVVRGEHATRGVKTKKDAAQIVRDGARIGSATLEWDDGAQRVTWPDAEVQSKGPPRALGTAIGIGAVRWMDLSEKVRSAELSERLALQPTKDDLAAFLREREVAKETVDAVWSLVEDQGWDAAHKKATEQVQRLRGRWEQVTGTAFGSKKAETWCPPVLDDAETYTEEAAADALKSARAKVEELLVAGAITDDEVQRVRAAAEQLGPAQAAEKAARARIAEADAAIEKEREKLAKIGPTDQAAHTYPCPHCERPVYLQRKSPNDPFTITKPPAELPAAELKKRRLETQAAQHAIEKLQRDLDSATRAAQSAVVEVRAAEAATKRLAELDAMPKVNAEQLGEARAAASKAEAVQEAVKAWAASKEIFAEWQRSQPVLEALAPTGVRGKRAAEASEAFNKRLATIAGTAGFGAVALDANTDASLNGRPYALLSESERWRVDLVLTLAFAEIEKPSVVLVDRLDILNPQARPGVFMALTKLGVPAVVACTAKEATALPPLHRAKVPGSEDVFGRTYWMEAGRLAPVE